MRRNRSRRIRWWTYSAVGLVLVALGLALVNAIDYAPYGLAMRRAATLPDADLESLAGTCTRYEQRGHQRLFGNDIPADFRHLKPVRVSIYPGSSDISLLENGDERYVFIRVSTSAENQTIDLVSFNGRQQESRRLWEKRPDFTRRLNPLGRVVTVAQWDMRSGREWIVLPDVFLVIDRSTTAGGSDQVVTERSLAAEERAAIQHAIARLPPGVRGRAFDAGVIDGIGLRISFSTDGAPNSGTDIVLENTWRSELDGLINSISKAAGNDHAIPFADVVRRMESQHGRSVATSLPLREHESRLWSVQLPWWCWWPRFQGNPIIVRSPTF